MTNEHDKIKVLVVDDSFFMRNAYKNMLSHNDIKVIDYAKNGEEAVEKAIELNPDIIIMDIEMPLMDGIEATKIINQKIKTNILVISSLTKDGADKTIEALSVGAVDFITKKQERNQVKSMESNIIEKILQIGKSSNLRNKKFQNSNLKVQEKLSMKINSTTELNEQDLATSQKLVELARNKVKSQSNLNKIKYRKPYKINKVDIEIILIGISTGGPIALNKVLPLLNKNIPVPIIIVQHMPSHFTNTLSKRLDDICKLSVKEAEDTDIIKKGNIYIAPGGRQLVFKSKINIDIVDFKDKQIIYKPSVNITLASINKYYKGKTLGIIMTGMGQDGAEQIKVLHDLGGYNFIQSEKTCVVSGMVKAVKKQGIADDIIDLDKIAEKINSIWV